MNIGRDSLRRLGILLVILHALVTTPHSIAHTNLYIAMDIWQNIYIFLVILIAPIVAAILIWKRKASGFVMLALSMVGSFVFGVYYHFVAIGSDNVFTLPASAWTLTFQLTAWLLAITELAGAVVGFLGIANRFETIQSQ
jgi:hypothetical protein